MSWPSDAACREAPAGLHDLDPDPTTRTRAPSVTAARTWCAACPVALRCLVEAMREEAGGSEFGRAGMRGALTGRARTRLATVHGPRPHPRVLHAALVAALSRRAR